MTMLKALLIGSQFFGLYLFNFIELPKEVILEHDLPTTTVIGSEHWVYVTIDKHKINGFAKLQVDVPKGIQIEPGDLRGASFTFAEGAAKIIWMSLPQDEEFKISYKLTVYDDCFVGNNTIRQKFAYLEKNERKVQNVPDHTMYVGGENITNKYVPDTLANGIRTITQLNGDHYLVELDLYKDGIKGFAKIEELVPEGMNAEAVKKSNAVFTQIDNKVKFVWFSIPEEDSLTVVYELFAATNGPELIDVEGSFTYLRNNESKSIALDTEKGELSEEEITNAIHENLQEEVKDSLAVEEITEEVAETVEEVEITEEVVEAVEETTEEVTQAVEVVEETIEEVTEEIEVVEETIEEVTEPIEEIVEETTEEIQEFQDISNIPSPDKGVTYRVQIAAGKNVVDEKYFKERHKFSDAFSIENHEEWVKYTTGSHSIYKEARDKRVYINDNFNFDGPFVTAYSEGTRITVQEALMITRQKWYQ